MVQFSPSMPKEITDAFKALETKNTNDQGTVNLFKKALQHVDEITIVDKKKFIEGIKEHAKNNPELNKIAIKILLEAGSKEREVIDKKVDELPNNENFLERYEYFEAMFGSEYNVSNSTYLELCSSSVPNKHFELIFSQFYRRGRTPENAILVLKALQNIPNDDFMAFYSIFRTLITADKERLIELIPQMDAEEVKALCETPSIVSHVLSWDNDAFKNFYHNAKLVFSETTDPEYENATIHLLFHKMRESDIHDSVFSKEVGDFIKNIDETSVQSAIIEALLEIPNNDRDEILKQSLHLARESSYGFVNLSSIIKALKNVPAENREKMETYILQLMGLVNPNQLPAAMRILNECPQEKLPQLIDLAKAAKEEYYDITYDLLKGLVSLPPAIAQEILSKLKSCSSQPRIREQVLNKIVQVRNKEEITQILDHILTVKEFADSIHVRLPQVTTLLLSMPPENRESAVSSLIRLESRSEMDFLLFGSFSAASQGKLGALKNRISVRDLIEKDPSLKEEFTKNFRVIIQNADVEILDTIIKFLNDYNLWMPSFAENILKKDMTKLGNVLGKDLEDEIVNYAKTHEGLLALAKVGDTIDVEDFLEEHFTEEERLAFNVAIDIPNVTSIENIASPDVLAYIKEPGFFIKTSTTLTTKPERNEPLSEESRVELQDILNKRGILTKRDWKGIHYTEEMISELRPKFSDIWKQLQSPINIKKDKTYTFEDEEVRFYGEELGALHFYTSDDYLLVNGVLDNDTTSLSMWCQSHFNKSLNNLSSEEKQEMENAIQALDTIFDLLASAINKLPIETNPIYRGDALPETELSNWKVGKVFATSKIFSCSNIPGVCEYFAKSSAVSYMEDKKEKYKPVIYVIDSKSSHDISKLSRSVDENERCYLPNQCFQVQGIDETTRPGLAIIYLSEVDPEHDS